MDQPKSILKKRYDPFGGLEIAGIKVLHIFIAFILLLLFIFFSQSGSKNNFTSGSDTDPSGSCTPGETRSCNLNWDKNSVNYAQQVCGSDGKWIRTGIKGDEHCVIECNNGFGTPCPNTLGCVVGRCGQCETDLDCASKGPNYACDPLAKVCYSKETRDMSCKTDSDCSPPADPSRPKSTNGMCINGQCQCGIGQSNFTRVLGVPNENRYWVESADGKYKCGSCVDGMGLSGKDIPAGIAIGAEYGDAEKNNTCALPHFIDPITYQLCGADPSLTADQACDKYIPSSYGYSPLGTSSQNHMCQINEYYAVPQFQPTFFNNSVLSNSNGVSCQGLAPNSGYIPIIPVTA